MKRFRIAALVLMLATGSFGCSALAFNAPAGFHMMGGTIVNTHFVQGTGHTTGERVYFRIFGIVDFLPSMAVDIATLPIAGVTSMIRDVSKRRREANR